MVFICIICMIKQPALIPLSAEHRQLLEVIVSPVINTTDLKVYQLLHCRECEALMQAVHNFQQTALKGVKAFKYLLSQQNEPTTMQTYTHKTIVTQPILEVKPELITVKPEPGIDPSATNTKTLAPEEANSLHDEVHVKIETDYSSDSTMSCDEDSRMDQDPTCLGMKSTDPLGESASSPSQKILMPIKVVSKPVLQNVLKNVPVSQCASNSQVKVYSKKPDPKPRITKYVITVKPQPAKKVQLAKVAPSANVATIMPPITKGMVAANASKVVPTRENLEARPGRASDFEFFPGFSQALKEYELERGRAKKKKYKRKEYPRLSCPQCAKSLKGKHALNLHISMIHTETKPVACNICGKVYRNDITLDYHCKYKHRKGSTMDDFNPDLYCKQCEAQFTSSSALKQHLLGLKHTPREQYTFVCETCSKRFPSESRRQLHINVVHLNKKHHKCSTCGKRYARPSQVRRHVAAAHEHVPKRRPHVCHLCGKTFTVTKSLKEHLLSHQGIRPFHCKLCPATFSYSAALFTHNRLKHLKIKWKKKKADKETEEVGSGVKEVEKGVEEVEKGVEEVEKGVEEVKKGVDEVEKGVEVEKGAKEVENKAEKGIEPLDIDQFFNIKTV